MYMYIICISNQKKPFYNHFMYYKNVVSAIKTKKTREVKSSWRNKFPSVNSSFEMP